MRVALFLLMILFTLSHPLLALDNNTACQRAFDGADYAQAKLLCLRAAEQGSAESQTRLGEIYDRALGGEVNPAEVRKWWQRASQQSYLPAQNLLALKYYYGGDVFGPQQGWVQDYQQARAIWLQSALQGAPTSQFMLGEIYLRGQGVAPDYSEAYAWFKLALEGGYKLATDSLIELSKVMSLAQERDGNKRLISLRKEILKLPAK